MTMKLSNTVNHNRSSSSTSTQEAAVPTLASAPETPSHPTPLLRQAGEVLTRRCHLLPEEDGLIVRSVYGKGQPIFEVARLIRTPPRDLPRRLSRLVRRILTPEFAYVIRRRHRWAGSRLLIAEAVFIHGKSIRQAAAEAGVTFYIARRHRDEIRLMAEGGVS